MNTELLVKSTASKDAERSISTAQAARLLGMSLTSVQKLVDQAEVHAWKTPGGHRRIDLASVRGYQNKLYIAPGLNIKARSLPILKVVAEEESTSDELKKELAKWSTSFEASFWGSLPDAFLSFTAQSPDLLIVQMSMPLNQQIQTVLALEKFIERGRKSMSAVCLGCSKDLKGKVKHDVRSHVQLSPQPLTSAWLDAFLTGASICSSVGRRA